MCSAPSSHHSSIVCTNVITAGTKLSSISLAAQQGMKRTQADFMLTSREPQLCTDSGTDGEAKGMMNDGPPPPLPCRTSVSVFHMAKHVSVWALTGNSQLHIIFSWLCSCLRIHCCTAAGLEGSACTRSITTPHYSKQPFTKQT